jgi:hypothetical protein
MARKSIYLRPSEYNALERAKSRYEQNNGSQTDWGAFLILLLGLVAGAKLLDTLFSDESQNRQT